MKFNIYFQRFKNVVLLSAVCCVLSLYACGDNSPVEEEAIIRIPTSQLSWDIPHDPKTISIDVTFSQKWRLEMNAQTSSWLSVSPKEGDAGKYTLQVTVAENTGEIKRTSTMTLCSGTTRKEITITQDGVASSLTIPSAQLSWHISHEPKTISVDVASAKAWKVELDAQTSSWLNVSPEAGEAGNYTLQIAVAENTGKTIRSGIIAVCSGMVRKEITVTQDVLAASLEIPYVQLSWHISHEPKTISVDVASTKAWKVEQDAQTSSWLSIAPEAGEAGNYTLQITVAENIGETIRSGIIAICSDTVRKEITVTQAGLAASVEIPADQLSWNLSHEPKTINIDVTSAKEWKVELDAQTSSWLTVSPQEGKDGIYTLQITVAENTGETMRRGIIAICSGTVRKEITVTQAELAASVEIPADQLSWNLSHEPKTIRVDVTSAKEWKVELDDETSSWLTVSPKEGKGGIYTLQITVAENTGETMRSGIIAVCSGTVRKEITIIQKEYIFKPEDGGLEDMPMEEWK